MAKIVTKLQILIPKPGLYHKSRRQNCGLRLLPDIASDSVVEGLREQIQTLAARSPRMEKQPWEMVEPTKASDSVGFADWGHYASIIFNDLHEAGAKIPDYWFSGLFGFAEAGRGKR